MRRLVLAEDAAQGGLKSWSELLELDGVNKRVDGGVCVAKPEHKTGPARGEGKLRGKKIIRKCYDCAVPSSVTGLPTSVFSSYCIS